MSSEGGGRRELPSLDTPDNKGKSDSKSKKKRNSSDHDLRDIGKKKSRKSEIGKVLESIREDIVTSELPYTTFRATTTPACISCAGDLCYMEGNRKFKKTRTSDLKQAQRPSQASTTGPSNSFTALHFHNAFKSLSLLLNGLLAGVMMWQLISIYASNAPVANHYSPLSLALHSIYYFGTALCLVAALDRIDVSQSPAALLHQLLSCQSLTPLLLITSHVIGLLTSLAAIQWDLSIGDYSSNNTFLNSTDSNLGPVVWQVLNIIRAAVAMLAWLLVSMSPREDNFTDVLKDFQREDEQEGVSQRL